MKGVGVAPGVAVVQFGNKPGEFPGIQADSLCPRRQIGADLWVYVAWAADGRTGGDEALAVGGTGEHDLAGCLIHRLHPPARIEPGLRLGGCIVVAPLGPVPISRVRQGPHEILRCLEGHMHTGAGVARKVLT
jgi:hypothetical protein